MTSIPWQRLAAESIAIVAGILLAFAIDAWWEEQGRIVEEIESLGLIHRDLTDTVEQLAGYRDFAEVGAHAAIDAYGAITGPGPYDAEVIRDDMLLVDRRTVVILYQNLGSEDLPHSSSGFLPDPAAGPQVLF